MRKFFKLFLCFMMVVTMGIFISKTFADEKLEVIDMIQEDDYSAVLYSDGSVYYWNLSDKLVFENVKKMIGGWRDLLILDKDNNLKSKYYYNNSYLSDIASNVKDFDEYFYLTNDDVLYDLDNTKIMDNVKEWKYLNGALLILDNNNSLYGYGNNIFGKKINDGEEIVDVPLLIAQNISNYDNKHYITKDGDLYIFNTELAMPRKIYSGISNAYLYDYNCSYYIKDNGLYAFNYEIENGSVNILSTKKLFELKDDVKNFYFYSFYSDYNRLLTENGDLYYIGYFSSVIIDNDVKQVSGDMYLKNNGNVYSASCEFNKDECEVKYLFNAVDKIISDNIYALKDGTILTNGINYSYDIGNYGGIEAKNYENYVVIEGLPNVPSVIKPIEITMEFLNKTEFVVGDTFDYYATVYPHNAIDKGIKWSSSNPNVVTVDQKGTLKFVGEGTATISVKFDNYDISDSVEVKVYPKVSGIMIVGGDSLTFNKNDDIVLTANILPDNSLEQNVIWSTDAGTYESEDGTVNDIIYFNRGYCGDDVCKKNQINVDVNKTGKYTITATTEDGLYSDSIEIVVKQDITSMGFDVDTNNILGSTLYMYLKESNKMDLKVRVYPEDATDKRLKYESSDESIATVDDNGIVTGHKDGKVTITIKAVEGDAERKINILVFGNSVTTKVGDIDGDGEVDIFDLIQLRISLAGDDVE